MIDLHRMSVELAKRSRHRPQDWHLALARMVHEPFMNQLTDGEIYQLAEASQSPEQMMWLLGVFELHFDRGGSVLPFDLVLTAVKRSNVSMAVWIDALHVADRIAEEHSHSRSLEQLVEFVSGCLSTLESGSAFTLDEIIRARFQAGHFN